MITAVEGTLASSGIDWADVEVHGVTLRVLVPSSVADSLGSPGDRVRLFTSLQVREDSLMLYGFPNEQARSAFEALLGVNGVGPRNALSVLSTLSPESVAAAVAAGDSGAFKGVHGVGAKTAGRIVLDLKGKLDGGVPSTAGPQDDEVVQALTALGVAPSEALAEVAKLPSGSPMTLEERVTLCLQRLGGG